jgi:predicted membrane GTPase involved in stress response
VAVIDRDGAKRAGRVLQVMGYLGLERVETAARGGRRYRLRHRASTR